MLFFFQKSKPKTQIRLTQTVYLKNMDPKAPKPKFRPKTQIWVGQRVGLTQNANKAFNRCVGCFSGDEYQLIAISDVRKINILIA